MKKQVEFIGKKVQDAVNNGLAALGISLDDADIQIISSGGLLKKAKVLITYDDGLTEEQVEEARSEVRQESDPAPAQEQPKPAKPSKPAAKPAKSNNSVPPEGEPHWGSAPVKREPTTNPDFGKPAAKPEREHAAKPERNRGGNKPAPHGEEHARARESVLPTPEQTETAKVFLTDLLKLMNVEGEVAITVDEGMRVNINTEDSRVIGHRGEVLDSMQQLISSIINTEHGKFVHVTVDGLGYRDRRKDTLVALAQRMADKAVKIRRKVSLDAMNSADRRIVHSALGERDDVFTRSEGHEPSRRVVIIPKRR